MLDEDKVRVRILGSELTKKSVDHKDTGTEGPEDVLPRESHAASRFSPVVFTDE